MDISLFKFILKAHYLSVLKCVTKQSWSCLFLRALKWPYISRIIICQFLIIFLKYTFDIQRTLQVHIENN